MTKTDFIISSSGTNSYEHLILTNEICESMRSLTSFIHDKISFIEGMNQLGVLLNRYDPPLSRTLQSIDEKGQDLSTYFVAAYFNTKDANHAFWIYTMIRMLVRYILLSDRFYEIGNKEYDLLASKVRRTIREMSVQGKDRCLGYSIDYALEQFWTFWRFEQQIKSSLLKGHTFSYKEIRHHNLFKSSDASIIYARVLESELADFSENVSLILHYNQALLDLEDDFNDIEDDVREDMPNVFVMAATEDISYETIRDAGDNGIRDLVLNKSKYSKECLTRLIDEYNRSIIGISVPDGFSFLKLLSKLYVNRLRTAMKCSARYS